MPASDHDDIIMFHVKQPYFPMQKDEKTTSR